MDHKVFLQRIQVYDWRRGLFIAFLTLLVVAVLTSFLFVSRPVLPLFFFNVTHLTLLDRNFAILLLFKTFSPLIFGIQLALVWWVATLLMPLVLSPTLDPPVHTRILSENVHGPFIDQAQQEEPLPSFEDTDNEEEEMPEKEGSGPLPDEEQELSISKDFEDEDAHDTEDDEEVQNETPVEIGDASAVSSQLRVKISFLNAVGIQLVVGEKSIDVSLPVTSQKALLVAYLGSYKERGVMVHRDRMIEDVFGHGKSDEYATKEKLGEAFNSHKKLLLRDIRKAILTLNQELEREVAPATFDIMMHKSGMWTLSDVVDFPDLDAIITPYKKIEMAKREGRLASCVPEDIKRECALLIEAYKGDFLQEIVDNYLDKLDPWSQSWVRKPYTFYRDCYLQAVWYAAIAEYEAGQQDQENRDAHVAQAAQLYYTYAIKACNSRVDSKVTFGQNNKAQGERVVMSERAIRRALYLSGQLGRTDQADQMYSAYYRQMRSISAKVWSPSAETLQELQNAKGQTNGYKKLLQQEEHLA